MGNAKQRAARIRTPPTNREIEQSFRAIQAEGGGVYMLTLCSPFQGFEMLSRARSGDRVARAQLDGIERMLALVQRDPAIGPLCLLCGVDFGRDRLPVLFSFLSAHRDDPTAIIANAICPECSAKHPTSEAMQRVITDYYRSNLIPDLRVLPQLSEAGHA